MHLLLNEINAPKNNSKNNNLSKKKTYTQFFSRVI